MKGVRSKMLKKEETKIDKFKDPEWTGKFGLTTGLIIILFNIIWVSLFKKHTPSTYVSSAPIIIGGIGIYHAIKKRSNFKIIFLNALAIIIGLVAPLIELYFLKFLLSK